jgi:ribonuclease P protein component
MALNRELRLRKSSEFQRIRQQGRSLTSRLLILAWMPNEVARLRIGFVVSKRISKHAVERNYIKRLLSEAIRSSLPELARNWDIVLSARNAVVNADVYTLQQDTMALLRRAGLLEAAYKQNGSKS